MSTLVPANAKVFTSAAQQDEIRQDRDDGDEDGSRQRDAVHGLAEVPLGLRTGAHAGDEAALLADLIGLAHRVEGDRVVEVGERDDEQGEDRDVHDVLAG